MVYLTGTASETEFMLNCQKWKMWLAEQTPNAKLYVQYSIRHIGSKRSFPFHYGDNMQSKPVFFPVGSLYDDFKLEVVASIIDAIGDSYEYIRTVVVLYFFIIWIKSTHVWVILIDNHYILVKNMNAGIESINKEEKPKFSVMYCLMIRNTCTVIHRLYMASRSFMTICGLISIWHFRYIHDQFQQIPWLQMLRPRLWVKTPTSNNLLTMAATNRWQQQHLP